MSHKFKGSGDDQEEPGIDEEDDVRGDFFLQSSPPPALLLNLWLGRNDPESTLAVLRGHDDVVRIIYGLVVDWWRTSIVRGPGKVFAARIGAVKFPKNAGRYCNMMPIMLPTLREWRDATRDERPWVATIPDEFKAYIPLIEACPLTEADEGEIGYLTVDERATEADGQPQRRGGLHAESPGYVHLQPGGGGAWAEPPHPGALTFMWGGGHYISTSEEPHGVFEGGVYMASNVAGSTRLWNAQVSDPAVYGRGGDLENLRPLLGKGETLGANALAWMTDQTPHESLPLPAGTRRQYFRLVTSKVTAWYASHSTPNPLGVVPPPGVRIVRENKFTGELPAAEAEKAQKVHEAVQGLAGLRVDGAVV